MINANVVLLCVDELLDAVREQNTLFFSQEALEKAVLRPFAETTEQLVQLGTTAVAGNIIGDEIKGCVCHIIG